LFASRNHYFYSVYHSKVALKQSGLHFPKATNGLYDKITRCALEKAALYCKNAILITQNTSFRIRIDKNK